VAILLAPDEAEPRGADGEADEQVPRQGRQPRAPRELAADMRGEQEEAEGQGRARFERTARGHAVKESHHQNQCEQARD